MQNELGYLEVIQANGPLVCIACFGGLVLFGLRMAEHFNRPEIDKLSNSRYVVYALFLLITLPILGGAIVAIYLVNGDRISSVLAFQVGLTSPAIVQSLITAAANNMAKNGIEASAAQ